MVSKRKTKEAPKPLPQKISVDVDFLRSLIATAQEANDYQWICDDVEAFILAEREALGKDLIKKLTSGLWHSDKRFRRMLHPMTFERLKVEAQYMLQAAGACVFEKLSNEPSRNCKLVGGTWKFSDGAWPGVMNTGDVGTSPAYQVVIPIDDDEDDEE